MSRVVLPFFCARKPCAAPERGSCFSDSYPGLTAWPTIVSRLRRWRFADVICVARLESHFSGGMNIYHGGTETRRHGDTEQAFSRRLALMNADGPWDQRSRSLPSRQDFRRSITESCASVRDSVSKMGLHGRWLRSSTRGDGPP